ASAGQPAPFPEPEREGQGLGGEGDEGGQRARGRLAAIVDSTFTWARGGYKPPRCGGAVHLAQ
ncbi:MAG: hypothetical protein WCF05_13755, partial [Chromatiaceae bacterium]